MPCGGYDSEVYMVSSISLIGNRIKCAVCGASDKTLLNREGKYICRDCYAKILELRIMKGM